MIRIGQVDIHIYNITRNNILFIIVDFGHVDFQLNFFYILQLCKYGIITSKSSINKSMKQIFHKNKSNFLSVLWCTSASYLVLAFSFLEPSSNA